MGISRKEYLRQTAISFGAALVLRSSSGESFPLSERRVSEEWKKGFDGQTVWQAKGVPVYIKQLSDGRLIDKITIDGVDFQMFRPSLGRKERILRDTSLFDIFSPRKVSVQEVSCVIPTVTGMFAHYEANVGYIYQNGREWDFYAEPYPSQEALTTYLVIDRFYDNKIVNSTVILLELARAMKEKGIAPGEEFSFLKRVKLDKLESDRDGRILMGKGLVRGEDGKPKLVPMFGGGICVSVTAIAKMARQAEVRGFVRLTEFHPHGNDARWWYFMNPDDPTSLQVDATVYAQTETDFKFQNLSEKTLYLIPKVQIIPDPPDLLPKNYNGLEHSTAYLIFSTSLRTTPLSEEEVTAIERILAGFRQLRKI